MTYDIATDTAHTRKVYRINSIPCSAGRTDTVHTTRSRISTTFTRSSAPLALGKHPSLQQKKQHLFVSTPSECPLICNSVLNGCAKDLARRPSRRRMSRLRQSDRHPIRRRPVEQTSLQALLRRRPVRRPFLAVLFDVIPATQTPDRLRSRLLRATCHRLAHSPLLLLLRGQQLATSPARPVNHHHMALVQHTIVQRQQVRWRTLMHRAIPNGS